MIVVVRGGGEGEVVVRECEREEDTHRGALPCPR